MKLTNQPMSLSQARYFTEEHHRHMAPLKRHMFTIGAYEEKPKQTFFREVELQGIATIDRCSSAWSSYSDRLEIRRLCTKPKAAKNTASFLLGKCKQAVFAMGYDILVTYTQPHETGVSLKAAGFCIDNRAKIIRYTDGSIEGGLVRWIAQDGRQPYAQDREFTDRILHDLFLFI